jgi:hypothetical protein
MVRESGERSASRRRGRRAMARRRERAPRSQPPDAAKADGGGFGIGSKPPRWRWLPARRPPPSRRRRWARTARYGSL